MIAPTVKHQFRDTIVAAMDALDVDCTALVRDARASDALIDPDETEQAVVARLWEAAIAQTGNNAIPMLCGCQVPFGTFEIVDFLGASTATLGSGLTQLARYFAIVTPTIRWRIQAESNPKQVALRHTNAGPAGHAFMQFTLGVTITRFRHVTNQDIVFERAQLACPPPTNLSDYRTLLGDCPLSFGHEETLLELPASSWNLPVKRGEVALHRVLEQHAQQLMAELESQDDALLRVRVAVREALPQGAPRLSEIARGLAMSERTLQRRLSESGFSFQQIVDEERHQTALQHIRNPRLAIGDVAYMLGYSESSAFVRAFKRWTGATPLAYRRRS